MIRGALVLAVGIGLGAVGVTAARHDEKGGAVKVLAARDIVERVDGKEVKATAVEVKLEPGQASAAHRHPGPALGYVLEGEYEWAIDDEPAKLLKAGDTFYEPAGAYIACRRTRRPRGRRGCSRGLSTRATPRNS